MVARRYHRESDLQVNLSYTVPIQISYQHWHKVMEEIIDNAFKFSVPQSAIEISDAVDQGYYEVVVQDHGRGMTAEQKEQIGAFVQFGRKDQEQQGLGLGLAIALLVINFHRGAIEFRDTVGGGTTIRIRIPIAEEHV